MNGDYLGYFEKHHFKLYTALARFWTILRQFLFRHLVTLICMSLLKAANAFLALSSSVTRFGQIHWDLLSVKMLYVLKKQNIVKFMKWARLNRGQQIFINDERSIDSILWFKIKLKKPFKNDQKQIRCRHNAVDLSVPSILPPRVRVPSAISMFYQFLLMRHDVEKTKKTKRPDIANLNIGKRIFELQ